MCSTGSPTPASRPRWSTCIISPTRSRSISTAARGRDRHLRRARRLLDTGGGIVKALPLLGDAPFFHVNSDTHLDRRREAQSRAGSPTRSIPARMDALLLLAPTTTSIGYAGRGDFAMAPDGRLRAARRARGGAVRLCGRRDPLARAVRRCAEGHVLAQHAVRSRDEAGRLYGLRLEGVWMHVGTPDGDRAAAEAAQSSLRRPRSASCRQTRARARL